MKKKTNPAVAEFNKEVEDEARRLTINDGKNPAIGQIDSIEKTTTVKDGATFVLPFHHLIKTFNRENLIMLDNWHNNERKKLAVIAFSQIVVMLESLELKLKLFLSSEWGDLRDSSFSAVINPFANTEEQNKNNFILFVPRFENEEPKLADLVINLSLPDHLINTLYKLDVDMDEYLTAMPFGVPENNPFGYFRQLVFDYFLPSRD